MARWDTFLLEAPISFGAAGDNVIVAAPAAGLIVRVFALFLFTQNTITLFFSDGPGGSRLTGDCKIGATQGFVLPWLDPHPWFTLTPARAFVANLDTPSSFGGRIIYQVGDD